MDDRWMRALLRPLDLLAFLSMTPVPPARELAEGPRPGAAGNGEKKNEHIGE